MKEVLETIKFEQSTPPVGIASLRQRVGLAVNSIRGIMVVFDQLVGKGQNTVDLQTIKVTVYKIQFNSIIWNSANENTHEINEYLEELNKFSL